MNVWSQHENGSTCLQEKLLFSSFIQVFEHRKIIKSIFNRDNTNNGYTKWFMVCIIGKWISVSLAADLINIYCLYTSWIEKVCGYILFWTKLMIEVSYEDYMWCMHIYIYIYIYSAVFLQIWLRFNTKNGSGSCYTLLFIKWS